MNREQRRAQERVERRKPKEQKLEEGAAAFMQTIVMNRQDAVARALSALFAPDVDGTIARLNGLGGATGAIQVEKLNEVANQAIFQGVVLPEGFTPPGVEPVEEPTEQVEETLQTLLVPGREET